ncbi:hypothetical protein C8R43DRAFT_959221 [Mycena crocata]|nr:hypothetical protein C8R43DRAFT_959221 [Mycena crocata]
MTSLDGAGTGTVLVSLVGVLPPAAMGVPEILSLVFYFVCYIHHPAETAFTDVRSDLILVCRFWRDVVYSIPDLWHTYVLDPGSHADIVAAFLTRCSRRPLSLAAYHSSPYGRLESPLDRRRLLRLFGAFTNVTGQWDALDLVSAFAATTAALYQLLATLEAPLSPLFGDLTSILEQSTLLQHLELRGVGCTSIPRYPPTLFLPSLSSLRLGFGSPRPFCKGLFCPNVRLAGRYRRRDVILDIYCLLPAVSSLDLRGAVPPIERALSMASRNGSVVLPKLRQLTVFAPHWDDLQHILRGRKALGAADLDILICEYDDPYPSVEAHSPLFAAYTYVLAVYPMNLLLFVPSVGLSRCFQLASGPFLPQPSCVALSRGALAHQRLHPYILMAANCDFADVVVRCRQVFASANNVLAIVAVGSGLRSVTRLRRKSSSALNRLPTELSSSSWMRFIFAYPAFWTSILITYNTRPADFLLHIRLAGPLPLDVRFSLHNRPFTCWKGALAKLRLNVANLLDYHQAISIIRICTDHPPAFILLHDLFLHSPLPLLRHFQARFAYRLFNDFVSFSGQLPTWFGGAFSTLRVLDLSCVILPFQYLHFPNLRVLRLHAAFEAAADYTMAFTDLARLVLDSPFLEELSIMSMACVAFGTDPARLRSDSVTSLGLGFDSRGLVRRFATLLDLPNLVTVVVNITSKIDLDSTVLRSRPRVFLQLLDLSTAHMKDGVTTIFRRLVDLRLPVVRSANVRSFVELHGAADVHVPQLFAPMSRRGYLHLAFTITGLALANTGVCGRGADLLSKKAMGRRCQQPAEEPGIYITPPFSPRGPFSSRHRRHQGIPLVAPSLPVFGRTAAEDINPTFGLPSFDVRQPRPPASIYTMVPTFPAKCPSPPLHSPHLLDYAAVIQSSPQLVQLVLVDISCDGIPLTNDHPPIASSSIASIHLRCVRRASLARLATHFDFPNLRRARLHLDHPPIVFESTPAVAALFRPVDVLELSGDTLMTLPLLHLPAFFSAFNDVRELNLRDARCGVFQNLLAISLSSQFNGVTTILPALAKLLLWRERAADIQEFCRLHGVGRDGVQHVLVEVRVDDGGEQPTPAERSSRSWLTHYLTIFIIAPHSFRFPTMNEVYYLSPQ